MQGLELAKAVDTDETEERARTEVASDVTADDERARWRRRAEERYRAYMAHWERTHPEP